MASRCRAGVTLLACVVLLTGCSTTRDTSRNERPFAFGRDTFAFANELKREYGPDDHGKWTSHARRPAPDYTLHCFVVARAAKQFFAHARFDPLQSIADDAAYRRLIRKVMARDARGISPKDNRVVFPGYADLHGFSLAWEQLLKTECGSAWQSYTQRGHWRMIFPFSRRHQEREATCLAHSLHRNRPAVIHVVRFPQLTINHAVIVFGVTDTTSGRVFDVYDPNNPKAPVTLTYDGLTRKFALAQNNNFFGGLVNVYEIYRDWLY